MLIIRSEHIITYTMANLSEALKAESRVSAPGRAISNN